MPKFQVTGTLRVQFDIEVEAEDEEAAEEIVMDDTDFHKLVENAKMPEIECESVVKVKAKKAGARK